MLPNFFVIGAPRSGTTSIYEYLHAHPDVFMSPVKEPDFFSRPCLDVVHPLAGELAASLDHDAKRDPAVNADLKPYLDLFSGARNQARRGEASAVYLGHPSAAWHLRGYLTEAKLVAILREPSSRAHSHYVHGSRIYAEHRQTEAIGAEGRSVDEEFRRVVDETYSNGPVEHAVSDPEVWIRSGFYHEHLTRWYSLYPRDQLLVFLYEDLVRDPNGLMRQVFAFLGVDDTFVLPTTEAFNASVVPKSQRLFTLFTTRNRLMRYTRSVAPARLRGIAMRTRNRMLGSAKPAIDPGLEGRLRAIYRDDVLALQDLIDRDLSAWLTAPGAS